MENNKKKRISEIIILTASIVSVISFILTIILFVTQDGSLAWLMLFLCFVSIGFIIFSTMMYSKIKAQYDEMIGEKLMSFSFVHDFFKKEKVKNIKYIKTFKMLPSFNIIDKTYITKLHINNHDIEVSELQTLLSTGQQTMLTFRGSMYHFKLDKHYEHKIYTTNKRLKVKGLNQIATEGAFRLYGQSMPIDNIAINPQFKSITIVVKDNEGYVLFERKDKKYVFSMFKRMHLIDDETLENDTKNEALYALDCIKQFIRI